MAGARSSPTLTGRPGVDGVHGESVRFRRGVPGGVGDVGGGVPAEVKAGAGRIRPGGGEAAAGGPPV